MKINLEHVAAGLALFLLAYQIGKKKGSGVRMDTADSNIQTAPAWWNYAGSWQAS